MKDIKLTLYDIFGYLVPGSVTLLAVLLIGWTVFYPTDVLVLGGLSIGAWVALSVLAYLFGHIAQAAANVIYPPRWNSVRVVAGQDARIPRLFRMLITWQTTDSSPTGFTLPCRYATPQAPPDRYCHRGRLDSQDL